jgi:subtilase family serine protease
MKLRRLSSRSCPLSLERLEERLTMSASVGSLHAGAIPHLASLKKPVGSSTPYGMTPSDIRTAYGFNNVSFNGVVGDGAGQTIAIVDARHDPTIVNDLHVFDQTFGLPDPPSFSVVNQFGGTKLPKKSRGWSQEIAIDVEWAHAIAPAANILLVEAKSSTGFGSAIDYARHVPGVTVVSVSAGGDEFRSEMAADALFTTPPGHVGITFVFAAGDDGGVAEYPSSSPNVLSVGGTSLYTDGSGQYVGESVWSDGGGGASKYEGIPSYQNGLGVTSRGTPDVTYNGDPETGFAVFDTFGTGGWAQFGGTSIGTPQWAALLAIANQGRSLAGKQPLANAQAALYAMPSGDFHDITTGNNNHQATVGYDLASGLGSPIANLLIPDLVAFNGSTDFTVTPLVSVNTGKTSKHVDFGSIVLGPGAIASQSIGSGESQDASVGLRGLSASNNVSRHLSYSAAVSTVVESAGASGQSIAADRELRGRASSSDSRRAKAGTKTIPLPKDAGHDHFVGVDTFFAGLAGARV